jgi:hypothetical protein
MDTVQQKLDRIQSAHTFHAQFLDNIAKFLIDAASLVEAMPNRDWSGSDGGCRRDMAKSLRERADDLRQQAVFARTHFLGEDEEAA